MGEDRDLYRVVDTRLEVAEQYQVVGPSGVRQESAQFSTEKFHGRAQSQGVPSEQDVKARAGGPGRGLPRPARRRRWKGRWAHSSARFHGSALAPGRAGWREATLPGRGHADLVRQAGAAVQAVPGAAPNGAALGVAVSALADVAVVVPHGRHATGTTGGADLAVGPGSAGGTDAGVTRDPVDASSSVHARVAGALVDVYSVGEEGGYCGEQI